MALKDLAKRAAQKFKKHYGREPRWIVAAPGRVNLIGEHTDYNDGFVLPMAIERYAVLAADSPAGGSNGDKINWFDEYANEVASIPVGQTFVKGKPKWSNYMRGVMAGFQQRGIEVGHLDVYMTSSVPLGGGLSSSAALEVATATLLEAATGKKLDPVEKALLCQKAEHDFAGVPCGIMDQFISALGREDHLLLLDCRTHETRLVPMSDPDVAVLIVNTNVRHELSGGEYAERRSQCEEAARSLGVSALRDATPDMLEEAKGRLSEVVFRRARHVIGENERTVHAAEGIANSNWPTVGQLMYASHSSLREDYEVSCEELDAVVEIALELGPTKGVYGCRMTGGGFGGSAVALVQTKHVEMISKIIAEGYEKRTGIRPSIFVSRPALGATVIQG